MTSTLSSPTTITEFPVLFDTMTTSSVTSKSASTSASVLDSATSSWFGMEDLRLPSSEIALSPPPTTKIKSFSWSDFPVIIQEEEEEEELISNDSDSISNSDDSDSMNYSDDDNDGDDDGNDDDDDLFSGDTFHTNTMYAPATSMPVPTPAPTPAPTPNRSTSTSRRRNRSTFYDADYIQSSSKNYVEDDYNGIEEEATKRARSAAQQYSPTSSAECVPPHQYPTQRGRGGDGRVVRFAEYIEVRTYNVVLGDHPWCEDGYAIELGNEVLSIAYQHHPHQYQYQHHSSSSLHRREYLERKSLLMEQMQVTQKELEEQQQQQYDDNDNDNDNQHHNNDNINININVGGGLSRIRSIDSCLSRVLNTMVNAAA